MSVYITTEVELRIAKQCKMPLLQELQGKGDGGWGKKCFCIIFLTDQKVASSWEKSFLCWHPLV